MLAKKRRLTHQEFLQAKKNGKNYRSEDASVVIAPNTKNISRFAIVTSTKLSKRAVIRNTLRRQLYDILGSKDLGQHDFLLFPRSSMLNLRHAELSTKVDSLLSKIPGLS